MERKAEKALLASAVYLTVKWASSPFGLPGVSGKLASLYPLEYILELTEKSQCCGSDNSVWQKGLQLPGKCTERTLLAITFLWESRIPYKESSKVTMPTSSGVQDKWCLFHSLPSVPKTPRLSLSVQHGAKQSRCCPTTLCPQAPIYHSPLSKEFSVYFQSCLDTEETVRVD